MEDFKNIPNAELIESINNAIISLGCIVNQDNADEIREAIITLSACKIELSK